MLGQSPRSRTVGQTAIALILASFPLSSFARAADLGGACCSDIEEKVAELDAALVRKGNRKVSLTVSGHVNRALLYWNDGARSNTYLGLDNSNSSTRIGFSGQARINTAWTAGFSILLEIATGARSLAVSQRDEDGPGAIGSNQDHALSMRDANWWLDNKVLGRLTVGRLTGSGPQGTIDIGGTAVIAPGTIMNGGGIAFRATGTNTLTALTLGNSFDALDDRSKRQEGVRYASPTFGGFSFTASAGEAMKVQRTSPADGVVNIGRVWGADLRYAAEFNGVRFAAAYGVEQGRADEVFQPFATGVTISDARNTGFSLSLMHAATGLFFQGHRTKFERTFFSAATGAPFVNPSEGTARVLALQGGVAKNWFGLGNTVVYGEWARSENGARAFNFNFSDADSKFWGLGLVQNIDAAAMELYVGYRKHSLKGLVDDGVNPAVRVEDVDLVTVGARIRF